MKKRKQAVLFGLALGFAAATAFVRAQEAKRSPTKIDFQSQVQPIFAAQCYDCHGPTKQKGGLRLDRKADALAGGESGPAIVPGNGAESLLIENVARVEGATPMPPKGEPLSAAQIATLKEWIDQGAVWPEDKAGDEAPAEQDHWAFKPIVRPAIPDAKDAAWVRTPIDRFILARLEKEGLHPSAEADRRTLIRRLTFDLHGLPPTPEEIEDFINDPSTDAYDALADRLLDSPRHGERWGRHWLDVVHFGETHGFDKDKRRDNAWPYRDYVIRSLNDDKSYSRFVQEQIAGDALFPGEPEGIIATGFLAAGPWDFVGHVELREGTLEKARVRSLDRDDMLANVASTFQSLTVHCARCHDHKFDPIPQEDYYRLQACLAGIDRGDRDLDEAPMKVLRSRLDLRRRELALRTFLLGEAAGAGAQEARKEAEARLDEAGRAIKALPPARRVYAALSHEPRPIHLLKRGAVESEGDLISPGALSLLRDVEGDFNSVETGNEGQRRAALARWVADRRNFLTWRSIVNRVWHYHFGRGIVDTPNDFGKNGARPTHPELLDWLAAEFRDGGRSLKALHRMIVTSAVYRQASSPNAEFARIDGDNRLLWRMNRRRLDAEEIRDAVLAVSGKLNLEMGGPSFDLFHFKDDHSPRYDYAPMDGAQFWRRSVYRFVVRSVPDPFFYSLDCADPNVATPARSETYSALSALAMLNDGFMLQQAGYFADRLKGGGGTEEEMAERACELAFGRAPKNEERKELADFARRRGMASMCRALLNANEFVFVD